MFEIETTTYFMYSSSFADDQLERMITLALPALVSLNPFFLTIQCVMLI
jgi:hypothetical protein